MSNIFHSYRGLLLLTITLIIVCNFLTPAQSKIKIGVYDSRAIAVAYFNSEYSSGFMKRLKDMKEQMKKAREDKDSAAIKKLRMVGNMLQAMQHEKSFGTGSVRYELLEIKDKVDSLAKAENLDGIVSKWELNFHGGNIEVVDVTEKIALLFEPNEKFKKMLPDLLKSEPMKEAYLLHD